MKDIYTIIIPIYNEQDSLPELLTGLEYYSQLGHEIIIIDDGSSDDSFKILSGSNFVKLIKIKKNCGKGAAIAKGLSSSKNNKIIIYDGDLELDPKYIKNLMILDKNENINCVFASRYKEINPLLSIWNFGNLIFTAIFNFKNKTKIKDALCCAKSFYRSDINIKNIKSVKFDIDVELASKLVKKHEIIKNINIKYQRRSKKDGKKLNILDSFKVLIRIFSH